MFVIGYTVKHMTRRVAVCAVTVGIVAALLVMMAWLNRMAATQTEQINKLYTHVEIRCTVSDARGTTDNLSIPGTYIQMFTEPAHELFPYIKNPYFKRSLRYTAQGSSGFLYGINDVRSDYRLSAENGVSISYAGGYSEESLAGDDLIVWAHEAWLAKYRISPGDSILLTVSNPEGQDDTKSATAESFLIAGSYSGPVSEALYTPWTTANQLAVQTGDFSVRADSLSFAVANNREIRRFKEVAAKYFSAVDISTQRYFWALTVHDKPYLQALTTAQKNLQLFKNVTPLYYFIVFGIGFLVCYLFTRHRRREFFLLRGIGLKFRFVMFAAVFEQVLLVLAGMIAGSVFTAILWFHWGKAWAVGLLAFSFLLGSVLSVLFNIRSSLLGVGEI